LAELLLLLGMLLLGGVSPLGFCWSILTPCMLLLVLQLCLILLLVFLQRLQEWILLVKLLPRLPLLLRWTLPVRRVSALVWLLLGWLLLLLLLLGWLRLPLLGLKVCRLSSSRA
jgi:hypothetical protein